MAKRKPPPKRKRSPKGTSREIVAPEEPPDPFEEYGKSARYNLSSMILFDLDNNPRLEDWIAAIYAIDVSNGANKAGLVELLNSTRDQRDMLLADLIDRWDLVKPRNRPRRPAYMMSDDDIALSSACGAIEGLREEGLSLNDAITRVTKERNISRSKLEDFRARRRRSVRKKNSDQK